MNIQERIEALETEFNEKIKALKEEVKQRDEFPQVEDDYWYVDDDTEVMGTVWYGVDSDQGRVSIDNVFKTKDQAEFAAEKLRVEAELRKFSTNFVLYKENWFLSLADTRKDVRPLYEHRNDTQGVIYFESREKAEEAMDTVSEERIKKYIFGVEAE